MVQVIFIWPHVCRKIMYQSRTSLNVFAVRNSVLPVIISSSFPRHCAAILQILTWLRSAIARSVAIGQRTDTWSPVNADLGSMYLAQIITKYCFASNNKTDRKSDRHPIRFGLCRKPQIKYL